MDLEPSTVIPTVGTLGAGVGGYVFWRAIDELKKLVLSIRTELRADLNKIDGSLDAMRVHVTALQQQRKEDFSRIGKMETRHDALDERMRKIEISRVELESKIVSLEEGHKRHRSRLGHLERNKEQRDMILKE